MLTPLSLGRIVLVRVGGAQDSDDNPVLRPAIVVQVWDEECANLQVFLDGPNDAGADVDAWLTSVTRGDRIGEWRWPPG